MLKRAGIIYHIKTLRTFGSRRQEKRAVYKLIASFCVLASLRGKIQEKLSNFVAFTCLFLLFFVSISPVVSDTLNLDEALKSFGGTMEFHWDPFFSSGILIDGRHQAAFISGRAGDTGKVLFDHSDVLTLPLPFMEGGNLFFPETFVNQVKSAFNHYYEEDQTRFRIAAIIIDPGHGGRDPGASWEHTTGGRTFKSVEKDITLKVSRQLHAALAAAYPGKQVLITREGDTNPSKEQRVDMANSTPLAWNEAAIYISVHANSSLNRSARGYEIWYLSPSYRREVIDRSRYAGSSNEVLPILNSMLEEELTTESILLANYILKSLGEAVGSQLPSRGLKAEEWFVVRNARMPSVLVELGFVSNETDALLMGDELYLKKLSEALYKGIKEFISFFERSGGLTALQ